MLGVSEELPANPGITLGCFEQDTQIGCMLASHDERRVSEWLGCWLEERSKKWLG
jgi:hypothetical protein